MPNNLRILYKNAARRATITASTTSGAHVPARMVNGERTEGWRSTAKTASITLTWATPEPVQFLGLMLCNLAPGDTMRVRAYNASNVVIHDSTALDVALGPAPDIEGYTAAQALAAYTQGGGAYARYWFPAPISPARVVVDIVATNNPGTYIEVVHLFAGPYIELERDVAEGDAEVTVEDTSEQYRTASGALKARWGVRYREMPVGLSDISANDRKALLRLLRSVGKRTPLVVALWPGADDAELERDTTIYGMLSEMSALTIDGPDRFTTSITISEL